MNRILSSYAYSQAPRARCFWAETIIPPVCPQAEGDLTAEVGIIGGGFTGLSAALHLAQAGVDAALFEAEIPGWGASGRNGGFCCMGGTAASNKTLKKRYGEDARREWRQTEKRAVDYVSDLIRDHGILADCHSKGETQMAVSAKGYAAMAEDAEQIRADLGVQVTLTPGQALTDHGMKGPYVGAMTTPVGFGLNPLKYATGLARAAQEYGARLYQNSPITQIETTSKGFHLRHPAGRLSCKKLIIATNGYSSDNLPNWMRSRYMPLQSNVLVTRPLTDDEIAAQGWFTDQMAYDELFFKHYFRLMPNRQFLFGMRGGLNSSVHSDAAMERKMRQHFERMFPAWAHISTPWFWTGFLSFSRDFTPFAGPIPDMPGAYTGLSYHGNGVAMGSYAGALLADLITDNLRRPYPDIMRTPPNRFPFGKSRRIVLWPVYMLAGLIGS